MRDKKVWSWAMYDWANSAYTTSIVTVFFPIFFKQYWAGDVEPTVSTFYLGLANSIAGFVVAFLSPLLGAMADQGMGRKRFLALFMLAGIIGTAAMPAMAYGQWELVAAFFVIATVGFTGSITFYDSLLIDICPEDKYDLISGFGFSIGYLGGGVLLVVNALMATQPELFGFEDKVTAVKWVFISVAIWWAIFAIPLFLWVPDNKQRKDAKLQKVFKAGFQDLVATLKSIPQQKVLFTFLLAYLFYMDGVATIIKMAVSYGKDLGIADAELIKAVILVQFVGFPAALAFGKLGEKIGAKTGIFVGLSVYAIVTIWGAFISHTWEFYAIAILIGLVQGGVQSLSRSAYTRLIPPEKAAEYFGFYSLFSKFSSIFGPTLMGLAGYLTGEPRFSILAVLILFILGAVLLARVPAEKISNA